jgi:hypothetical protein
MLAHSYLCPVFTINLFFNSVFWNGNKVSQAAFCLPAVLLFNEIGLACLRTVKQVHCVFLYPGDAVSKIIQHFLGASSLLFSRLSGKHTLALLCLFAHRELPH